MVKGFGASLGVSAVASMFLVVCAVDWWLVGKVYPDVTKANL